MTFDEWATHNRWAAITDREAQISRAVWTAAFRSGYNKGRHDAERDMRDAAAETVWKERQGDEYGSY